MKILSALYLCLLFIAQLAAQPLQQLEIMRNKYPGQIAVYLQDSENVTIDFKGDSIITVASMKEDLFHLSEQANSMSEKKIYYSYFRSVSSIVAETLVPEEKKYKSIKVTQFKDKQEQSSGIYLDDLKSKSFVFPAVKAGARTVLSYNQEIKDPRLQSSFYFGSGVPTEKAELTITVNKNIKFNYKLFNTEGLNIEYATADKGKYTTHTWRAKDLPSFPYESDAPSGNYYLPHIVYYLEEAKRTTGKENVLATVNDLHKWYYGFVKDIVEGKDDMPDLKETVDSLVAGAKDELEKVKRIYYWVQDNVSYVAIETGYRGFIPHTADLVYKNRYGDCKDMASIIYTMLRMAGIKSYLTWIGSRSLPYKYSDLPSPAVDNHMITTYINGEDVYFLDATSKYTVFGKPASHIQGKEALLSVDKDKYIIKNVPVVTSEQNHIIDSAFISIDGKKLKLKGVVHLTSYYKIFRTYNLVDLNYKKQKEYLTSYLTKGNNKFLLDTFAITNLREREKPLIIHYDGSIGDYFKEVDGEIYINLNLEKIFFHDKIDTLTRKAPKENTYCYTNKSVSVLTIPKGYAIDHMPDNVKSEGELFGFTITYQVKGDKIICDRTITSNYLILEKKHFSAWNAMVEKISAAYRDALILKKI